MPILYVINEKMHNSSKYKQLTKINQLKLGSYEKQHLLFSLVHIILC
jgi:hypothetical protein